MRTRPWLSLFGVLIPFLLAAPLPGQSCTRQYFFDPKNGLPDAPVEYNIRLTPVTGTRTTTVGGLTVTTRMTTYKITVDTGEELYSNEIDDPETAAQVFEQLCGGPAPPAAGGAFRAALPMVTASTTIPATGQASQSIAVGDLNGDGNADTVLLENGSATVTLLNASGGAISTNTLTIDPTAITGLLGDFNGDGKLDLAIANNGSGSNNGSVSIFLGNGDGTFQPVKTFSVAGSPFNIVAADFNNDGKLDVAVTDDDASGLWVLLGNGDGTLQTPVFYAAGGIVPGSMVAADFNGDGKVDLATLNFSSKTVSVLLGKSDGTFETAVTSPGGAAATSGIGYLGFADFNHDGKMDLAVAYSHTNALAILLGNGDGTFQTAENYATGDEPGALGIVPVNDGSFFIFTLNAATEQPETNYGAGDGTLSTPRIYTVGSHLGSIAVADLNGDHIPDVLVADTAAVDVMLRTPAAQTPTAYTVPSASRGPAALAVGDFNGDGVPDAIVANPFTGSSGSVSVLLGKGDGTLLAAQAYAAGSAPVGVVLADFNGDGKLDAAVVDEGDTSSQTDLGGVSILLGKGDGTFQPAASSSLSARPYWIVEGDFNGDGKADLALATGTVLSAGTIFVLLGNGDGTFRQLTPVTVGNPAGGIASIAAGDINADGKLDLAVQLYQNGSYSIVSLLGNGDGTFQTGPSTSIQPSGAIALVDVNGDGWPDVVATHGGGPISATLLLGNGDGSFQSEDPLPSGASPAAIATADFFGNGQPGLAFVDNPNYVVLLGNGYPGMTVTPASASLTPGQTQQFTAAVAFSSSQAVAWSVSPQEGAITATGLYTAPASITTQQTVTVTATSAANANNTGSATITLTPSTCSYALTAPGASVGAAAGAATVGVTAGTGCAWTATSNASWLTITAGASGTGNGTVSYAYTANPSTAQQSGSLTIAGQTFTVTQAGATGAFSLTPPSASLSAAGGAETVSLTATPSNAPWTIGTPPAWITITSPTSGTGSAVISYTAAANTSTSPRSGSVTIAGLAFSITQAGVGATAGLAFYPVTPCRIADTRTGQGFTGQFGPPSMTAGQTRSFTIPASNCNIPSTAQAYSLNVTVVPAATLGYLTIWPTGETQPYVSTLNSLNGAILANAAIVPAGTAGAVSVYVTDATDLIIDINGYFAPPAGSSALAFYPVTPCRVADTRNPNGAFGGPSLPAGGTRSFTAPSSACNIPTTAQAYSLNMTVVPPGPLTYLTTWPTGQTQPYVSTLNALQGQIAANAAIVPAGAGGAISVYVSNASNVIVDINGYFAPPGGAGALYFYPLTPCRVADTRNPNGTFGGPSLGAGGTRTFPIPSSSCGVPTTAQAYSFNMTVVPPGSLLYLSTWPAGQTQPVVSTLNDLQGQIVANAAIVPAGASGGISVYVSDPTNLVIDVNGYFQ